MNAIGPNPLEFVLLILLGGGFGTPSGVPPTAEDPLAAKIAPAKCLFYMSWAGTGTPQAASANHTEQMLAEPEIQAFLKRSGNFLLTAMQQAQPNDPEAQANIADVKKLLSLLQGKAGAFYVSDVQFNGDAPDIKGGGLLRVDGDGAALKALIEKFQSRLPEGQVSAVKLGSRSFSRVQLDEGGEAPPITWGVAGKYLLVGVGDDAMQELAQRARGQAPTWLNEMRQQLSVPRPASLMYANVERIVNIALEQVGEPDAERVVSALGLDTVQSFATVSGLDDKGCVTRSLLKVDGPGRGILSWIDAEPLAADELKMIGRGAPVAVSFKLDATQMLDLWMGLAGQIEPNAAQQMQAGLAQFEQQVGIKIRDDLLASLGDTWRIYAQPGPEGLVTGWTVSIAVHDRQKLEQVQETLLALVKVSLEQLGPGAPSLSSSEVNGHTVNTLTFGPGFPAAPSWCITDKELLVTVTPQSLEPLLSGANDGPSLAEVPAVKQLFDNNGKNLALAYVDTRQVVETLLPLAQVALQNIPLPPGAPSLDTTNLPPAKAFLPHLQPTVAALRRTDGGVEFISYQTMPGGNVGASAPVAVALLLPAVQAAREAARRMEGSNNLKQIALAMHNFHDTYKAMPAGYSADDDGKALLSWRVHILPFIEEAALYDQFHLDEPWDSPHNKELIAQMPEIYSAPGSSAEPGMTNYLGIGGADGFFVRPMNGEKFGVRFADITDGTSNTIMTVEAPDESAVIWTKPGDFAPNQEEPTRGLLGLRPGGFQVALGDGSVRFIAAAIDSNLLKGLFTKAGGEVVRLP
jgi:hypothetical protein